MEYKRFYNTIIMRIDPEEEIYGQLVELAEKENIMLAEISGLGAVREFTTGVFDTTKKEYFANYFQGAFEITSLTGTLNYSAICRIVTFRFKIKDIWRNGHE